MDKTLNRNALQHADAQNAVTALTAYFVHQVLKYIELNAPAPGMSPPAPVPPAVRHNPDNVHRVGKTEPICRFCRWYFSADCGIYPS
ncbi:MAG: hypothetical protein GXP15_13235 [Gammaproteobacteria bacterium]|nr:hypothetical protein [Gammaproteobacteria bacterium]